MVGTIDLVFRALDLRQIMRKVNISNKDSSCKWYISTNFFKQLKEYQKGYTNEVFKDASIIGSELYLCGIEVKEIKNRKNIILLKRDDGIFVGWKGE